jgi:4-hydroxybenzoyl-CoA thioesterase
MPGVRFAHRSRVRFGHCDPAGIAYYPRFFEWFHDAFEAFFEAVTGLSYAEVLSSTGAGFPAVSSACDWRSPARFGDLVVVEVFVSRLGERSGTFEYRVRRDDTLLASATVKVAVLDLAARGSRPWPASVRAALEPYVEPLDAEAPAAERLRG